MHGRLMLFKSGFFFFFFLALDTQRPIYTFLFASDTMLLKFEHSYTNPTGKHVGVGFFCFLSKHLTARNIINHDFNSLLTLILV